MATYYCVSPFHLEFTLRPFEVLPSYAPLFLRNMLDKDVRTFAAQNGDRTVYWVKAHDCGHPYILLRSQTAEWHLISLLPEAEAHYLTLRMAAVGVSGRVCDIPGVGYVGSKLHGVTLYSKIYAPFGTSLGRNCTFTFPMEDV